MPPNTQTIGYYFQNAPEKPRRQKMAKMSQSSKVDPSGAPGTCPSGKELSRDQDSSSLALRDLVQVAKDHASNAQLSRATLHQETSVNYSELGASSTLGTSSKSAVTTFHQHQQSPVGHNIPEPECADESPRSSVPVKDALQIPKTLQSRGQKYLQNSQGRIMCPFEGCKWTFADRSFVQRHVRKAHGRKIPVKNERYHLFRKNDDGKFCCPHCAHATAQAANLRRHIHVRHGRRWRRRAQRTDLELMLGQDEHGRYLCPHCGTSDAAADNIVHHIQTLCLIANPRSCATDVSVREWVCTVPVCIRSITKHVFERQHVWTHAKRHEARREGKAEDTFQRVHPFVLEDVLEEFWLKFLPLVFSGATTCEALIEQGRLPDKQSGELKAISHSHNDHCAPNPGSEDQLRDESEAPGNIYAARAKPGPSAHPRTYLNEDPGMTIWDHIENGAATFDSLDEELIRKTNTEVLLLEASRTPLRPSRRFWLTVGDVCSGTRLNPEHDVRDISEEEQDCPLQARITPDTASVYIKSGNVAINHACASCNGKKQWLRALKRYGLLSKFKEATCQRHLCLERPWMNSIFCKKHLRSAPLGRHEQPQIFSLRQTLATRATRQWELIKSTRSKIDFQPVIKRLKEIEKGDMSADSLVCMDLEFDVKRNSTKVYEIAIVALTSGQTLLDMVLGRDKRSQDAKFSTSPVLSMDVARLFNQHQLGKRNWRNNRLPRLRRYDSVQDVADRLKDIVKSDTLIITWHRNAADLRILRTYMEKQGYDMRETLPADSNCMPITPYFSRNLGRLDSGQKFCCKLEVLFPLFFPNHSLTGRNHKAIVDTLQLRIMALTFLELLKPPNERHHTWRPPAKQSSILQHFKRTTSSKTTPDNNNTPACLGDDRAEAQESIGESTQTAPLSLDIDDLSCAKGSVMETALIEDNDATEDEDWASIGAKALRRA